MPEVLKLGAIFSTMPLIALKVPLVLFILVLSVLIGLGFGFLLTMARIYRVKVLGRLASIYVTLIRGTPAIILLYLVLYALPQILQALGYQVRSVSKVTCVIIALGINSSAFFCEILRSAIENIDSGQSDAAYAIGMTRTQALFRILLPQARFKALPNISNTVLTMFKETALGFYIGLVDIMGQAKIYAVNRFLFFEMYLSAALIYWIICSIMQVVFTTLEKRSNMEVQKDGHSYIDF